MKHRKVMALLLAGTLICAGGAIAADPGSAADPLIALGWLKSTFIPNAVTQADARAEERIDALENSSTSSGTELRIKRGDVLRLDSGAALTPLAGGLSLSSAGTVVDITTGEEHTGLPVTGHRYLAAEQTQAAFSVTTDTAVVRLTGPYQLSPSTETDYNALADALKTMGLFKGTDTPYGSGYDLELAPTRIQGLVLFLRLMGEEQSALSYPGSGIHFTDVPDWALPYVAYAYDRGYTKGQGVDEQWRVIFGSDAPISAGDYTTFLLRALGYMEGSDFQWETALTDAQTLGVLTAGEGTLLAQKPFLRAQTVYLSYFALSAKTAGEGGGTLLERLAAAGAIDAATAQSAMSGLSSQRL
ncbi:hypothetical protein [Vermiculatibacterium agrestimuris]|uniref:hypothetical protein n=1 Tax=Vermiculatibacterium agrestimuris TaxID=2941519 RepID=UPI00203CBE7E|nr:hypothetical protein [Vermiculatibacterium agrestimuris]